MSAPEGKSTNPIVRKLAEQLTIPVIAAPMFLVSSPELVIESCKSGVIGSFPLLNARTTGILDEWMRHITEQLENARLKNPERRIAPWAVNLIVHRTNVRYEADLQLVKKYRAPIVITSLGAPGPVVDIVHAYGGLVFSDVSSLGHARKAADSGVDGLILVCSGAGGHAGTINPFAFMGAVREFWNGICILAGSISEGRDITAARALGADLAYMGTRFIATAESFAGKEYQQMLIESDLDDLINTDAFTGINANYLMQSIRNAGMDPQDLQKKDAINFSQMSSPEVKAWKDIWSAGQGVGMIKRTMPAAELIEELRQEYEQALEALSFIKTPN